MFWKILQVNDLKKDLQLTANPDGKNTSVENYIKHLPSLANSGKGFLKVSDISLQIIQQINATYPVFFNTNEMNLAFNMCKSDIIKKVAGKNGYYFKMTTQSQNALFIWHSMCDDKIYVWGSKDSIIRSLNVLYTRFSKAIYNLWYKIASFSSQQMSLEMDEVIFENEFFQSAGFLNQIDEEIHPFSEKNTYLEEDLELTDFNWRFEKEFKKVIISDVEVYKK